MNNKEVKYTLESLREIIVQVDEEDEKLQHEFKDGLLQLRIKFNNGDINYKEYKMKLIALYMNCFNKKVIDDLVEQVNELNEKFKSLELDKKFKSRNDYHKRYHWE